MKVSKKLDELAKTANEFWNITPECGNFLNMLIKSCGYKNIVEVGTSNGYSGIWLALGAKETGGSVITMEYHQCRVDLAEANFKECELEKYINIRQGRAVILLSELVSWDFDVDEERFVDFAFVDANKPEYIEYYKILDKLVRKGGMLVFDNVESHKEKVADFLETIENNASYQLSFLSYGGGVLLALRLD